MNGRLDRSDTADAGPAIYPTPIAKRITSNRAERTTPTAETLFGLMSVL